MARACLALLVTLLLGVLVGCGRRASDSSPAGSSAALATPGRARSQAFIQAGNEAYRAGDFELALKRYAAAAIADPKDPAAYFGMGMTFTKLKREDEARAAYAKARQLQHEALST
jgi:Flp pilus assembly protein TadD